MTVGELIKHLQTYPSTLLVAYSLFSEYTLMDKDQVCIQELCEPRDDGWLQRQRDDKPTKSYLVFPGN